jgi:hypothetical protein
MLAEIIGKLRFDVKGSWGGGVVIKGIKCTRIVIKMLKKSLGLTHRLFCSLVRAWQVYPLKACTCHEISRELRYCSTDEDS